MKAIRHIGIVVNNVDLALRFYRDILGLKIQKDMIEQGEFIDSILGLKDVKVRTIKMSADDGNLVELLYYFSHPKQGRGPEEICTIGVSHPAFTMNNLEEEYLRLKKQGIEFHCYPKISPDGNAKVTFCRDFEGNLVELVEEINNNNPGSEYLNVVYNEKDKPYTEYPFQLCQYLFQRFNMEKGEKLLDIGCGRGDFSKGFKGAGLEVSCMDLEESNSEILKGLEVKKLNFESDNFPFNNETFDIVFSKSVIEHLKNPENFIKESRRVLKPGGKIIIMTPDWQSSYLIFYNDYTHFHPYTELGIEDLLKIYGFKEIKTEKFYQLPILWKYPWLKIFSRILQFLGPVKRIYKNKFIRWSRELMILGYGEK